MTDDERLAERLAHLPGQLESWLAVVPPTREAAAVEALEALANDLHGALEGAEAAIAELEAEGAALSDEILHALQDLAPRLIGTIDALHAEAQRVAELLDPLHQDLALVTQLDAELKTMDAHLALAFTDAAAKIDAAQHALLEAGGTAHATLEAAWLNLGHAFDALHDAFTQAAVDVAHETEAVLPAAAEATAGLVHEITQALGGTLEEAEQALGAALAHLAGELGRQIGEATDALGGAIGGIGENAEAWQGAHDGNQFLREIEEITAVGERVAADAMLVPIKVVEILFRRGLGF